MKKKKYERGRSHATSCIRRGLVDIYIHTTEKYKYKPPPSFKVPVIVPFIYVYNNTIISALHFSISEFSIFYFSQHNISSLQNAVIFHINNSTFRLTTVVFCKT